jgi:NRPS condensation-like uncharacterized protein
VRRLCPFVLETRAASVALLLSAITAPVPEPWGGWAALAIAGLAAISVLRVPRLRLALEVAGLALALEALASLARGAPVLLEAGLMPPVLPLGLALLATTLRPESGTLALNGLDRYFIAQDYPGVRANSHHFVDVKDPLDRDALVRAVETLQRTIPLARTFVRESWLGVERFVARRPWVAAEELVAWLDEPLEAKDGRLDERIDLATRPPFRVLHAPRAGGHRLCLTVHHSAADGTAGMLLLDRLIRFYDDHRARRAPAPPPPYEPRTFRDLFRAKGRLWLWRQVRRHARPMDKVGVRNASLLDDEKPRRSTSRHRLTAIGQPQWDRLKQASQARGLTRNDLLLAAALRAADSWRRDRKKEERSFRVLLPTDLRPTLGLEPGFQNFVGVVRSDFSLDEVRSPDLPAIVSKRVKLGRELEEAIETPVNLGTLSVLLPPWAFRLALRSFDDDARSFFFSFLFSNIRVPADLAKPDGTTTEAIWVRGSITRQPGFGLVITNDGERVNVAIEYLSAYVSDESVLDFERRFLGEIERA